MRATSLPLLDYDEGRPEKAPPHLPPVKPADHHSRTNGVDHPHLAHAQAKPTTTTPTTTTANVNGSSFATHPHPTRASSGEDRSAPHDNPPRDDEGEDKGEGDETQRLLHHDHLVAASLLPSTRPPMVPMTSADGPLMSMPPPPPTPLQGHGSASNGSNDAPTPPGKSKEKPVRWRDLPCKRQLVILAIARLSEPLSQTSLQAYIFYQLRSFDPSLHDSTISAQVGLLQGCFTFAQAVTGMFWGYGADRPLLGRKRVLIVGLLGTMISTIGFGFSRTFWQAMLWRTLGGALNGNVGVLKTMIGEIYTEKRYQSRAFLLQPMCFNIGVIVGPVLGGLLADPVANYPGVFGKNSTFGGQNGVWWLQHWPYALPNIISAIFLLGSAMAVVFGLEETLESIRDRADLGLRIARSIANVVRRALGRPRRDYRYTALPSAQNGLPDPESPLSIPPASNALELSESPRPHSARPLTPPARSRSSSPSGLTSAEKSTASNPKAAVSPWRLVLSGPILSALLSQAILATHLSAFNSLWSIHLSTPRTAHPPDLPFHFTGGLGFTPKTIGVILACLGSMGILLQFTLYPKLTHKFGTLRTYRAALLCFPIAYTLAPYLSVVATYTSSSHHHHHHNHHQTPAVTARSLATVTDSPHKQPATGFLVYAAVLVVLALQVLGRTFALPGLAILINNAVPTPKILGTVNGLSQSVNAAMRTLGPVLGGWGYGKGMRAGVGGVVWWGMAALAVGGVAEGVLWLRDGWAEDDAEDATAAALSVADGDDESSKDGKAVRLGAMEREKEKEKAGEV